MTNPIKIGIVGTSWWTDAMYLPALATHPLAQLTAICGRNADKAHEMAQRWHIPQVFTDAEAMIRDAGLDAIVVASSNESHYAITTSALNAGLHVLCEKPLALTYAQAKDMADMADAKGVKHLVPFTYANMPVNRYIKQLVDEGFIGKPYHLNLRYYSGYGRNTNYVWRFDARRAGSGAVGDIGSHFMYLARWWFGPHAGEITEVSCMTGNLVERAPLDPSGQPYPMTDDTSVTLLRFASGAQAVIHTTTVAWEGTPFGQTHHAELHGSDGTLYGFCDWDTVQQVKGAKAGQGAVQIMPIPDSIWGDARRDTVHNTYRDVFRKQDHMARGWVNAIAHDTPVSPGFGEGAVIQRVIEAALKSAQERRFVALEEI
jgi:predicted dehydrogenase